MKPASLHLPEGYIRQPLPGKIAWVNALRSGLYRQGITFLCHNNNYCCLGVLCEIQNRPKKVSNFSTNYDTSSATLSAVNPFTQYWTVKGIFHTVLATTDLII